MNSRDGPGLGLLFFLFWRVRTGAILHPGCERIKELALVTTDTHAQINIRGHTLGSSAYCRITDPCHQPHRQVALLLQENGKTKTIPSQGGDWSPAGALPWGSQMWAEVTSTGLAAEEGAGSMGTQMETPPLTSSYIPPPAP